MNNSKVNNTSFDSYFQETILDNNGIAVCDINAGLVNLFKTFNDNANSFSEVERYLVGEVEEGYPDLIAKLSTLNDEKYWWWILLLNRLEDPFTDLKVNWLYSINSPEQINDFIDISNTEVSTYSRNERIGTVIELN